MESYICNWDADLSAWKRCFWNFVLRGGEKKTPKPIIALWVAGAAAVFISTSSPAWLLRRRQQKEMENLLVSKLASWVHGCPREREGGKWHHMHHFLIVQMTPNCHLSTPSLWFLSDVLANLALPYNPTPNTRIAVWKQKRAMPRSGIPTVQYKGDFKERDSCERDFKAFGFCSPEISVVLALQGKDHNYIFCRKDKSPIIH